MIRMTESKVDLDAVRDAAFSAYPESGTGAVSVIQWEDTNQNFFQILVNVSGTSIDPNADTTYDAAPINSLFLNGVSNDAGTVVYIKTTAALWVAVT